ncbi:hypothetical protein TELCIR_02916 [Teladorsagia circumcincta]|uniref:Endonuclease/exonuclease/phosphatase domain-containing protein n=1 Tax=Teladorsagia circumcincta TaxID=45464 RepID=A0A2G9UXS9_TELCI|nr:hypothetical protein TELCIR_02916 [Teladorsagia circumcincta]
MEFKNWIDRATFPREGARKSNSTSGGVGFIVSPEFSKHVRSVTFYGHLLAMLTTSLSRDVQITVIQVYAPIADSDEEEHDDFYEQLEELICRQRSYVVVMGDFNARIESRRPGEVYIGPHSAEECNEAGRGWQVFANSITSIMAIVISSNRPEKDGLI